MATFVITGVAGAGKTAFLNAMSRICAVLDLDALGVHYQSNWHVPPELIMLAYTQGFRVFGGVFEDYMFSTLRQSDPDMRILMLEPQRQALADRNKYRKQTGQPERWTFDPKANAAKHETVAAWARRNKVGMFDVARTVPMILHDEKGGTASADGIRSYRIAFPMPFKIGWNQNGSDPELDEMLTTWFTQLRKYFPLMKKFLTRFKDDFSASRWHHFFSVYAPTWGNFTQELWRLAAEKGYPENVGLTSNAVYGKDRTRTEGV